MACVLWLHLEYCSLTQLMIEMQRLVEDPGLRESSVSSWRSLLPDVFKQIELETTHNKRLRQTIANIELVDTGTKYTFYQCFVNCLMVLLLYRKYSSGSVTSAVCPS